MTHTINYKEILAFKIKKNQKDKPEKDYIATTRKILQKISKIKEDLDNDNFLVVSFDHTIRYVDPLFLILLLDLHHVYKSVLVLDIQYMDEKYQHYIHRLLTQYSDLENFETYSPYTKKENIDIYTTISVFLETDAQEREEKLKLHLANQFDAVHFFTNVAHKKSIINDSEYEYSLLPILRLRNFELKEIDTIENVEALDSYSTRRLFYNNLSLDQAPKKYRDNLKSKIDELLVAVGLETRGLSSSFRDIFFELIDNIRKHTPAESNAHLSFRKDIRTDQYELIVSDNSSKGFLNTYRETLVRERKRLAKSGVEDKYLKEYDDIIEDIDDKHYRKVLEGLFQTKKSIKKNSEDEIHLHQIPRIAMHFGLPLLIKLLEKLSKNKNKTKPQLKLFLHNDDQYFEITYNFNNATSQMHIDDDSKLKKEGTYIIVTFPDNVEMEYDLGGSTLKYANFKNSDYKLFIEKRDTIQRQVNKFTFLLDKYIEEDLANKANYACVNKCAFIKYTSNTFSEFLRNIYLYAYKHNIEDIVILNVPLYEYDQDKGKLNSENIEHIKLLETIIYGDEEDQYEKSLNVLFYSDRSPEAVLIGGKNQAEYCYLNNLFPSWDGESSDNNICSMGDSGGISLSDSKLFIELNGENYILPFEIFEIPVLEDKNSSDGIVSILRDMLEVYLNEVAKKDDVHIDTGMGYHIDRYMEFKKVFEDSRWVRRLAFRLAMQFPKKPENKKYYLYGTDKYTNMLISLCYTFLDLTFERFRYKLFNIYDEFDYRVLKKKAKALVEENTHEIYLVSSVLVNARKTIELIDDNPNYEIKAIPAIQLNIGQSDKRISPLVSIRNDVTPIKVTPDKYCHKCEIVRREPLLSLAENDPFFIENTFFGTIHAKKITSYSNKENKNVKWFDSLNFAHIERGNNHFLYYINTVKFFNQNRDSIKDFLKEDASLKIKYDKEKAKENIILLTSSHDTNNNFVAMVNQEVFGNDAIILSFSKTRGEANFHDLDSYKTFDWTNTRVFFVDDSIASSHTVKYFYQLLRSIPDIMKEPNIGLDGMIIMIDRISSYDETILCSYLKDSPDLDRPNEEVQKEKLERIHAFATFDIKPIKSEVEKCFLCTRNSKYLELAQKSALDLMTFQMVKRAYKIRKLEYRATPSAKERKLIDRFKTYLKAMATIYIYQKFADKKEKEFGKFDDLVQEFSDKIYDELLGDKEKRFKKYEESIFKKIMKFQAEIAFIKALSSPRLSYYYEVRKWMTRIILAKLNIELSKTINKDFELEYIFRNDIENLDMAGFDEKDLDFLNFYKNMTNLNLVNVCWATLGYFQDSKILDTDYIQFFYKITQNKDVRAHKGDPLLHTYPFAVKFTIADNLEKSIYLEKNIETVLSRNSIKLYERKKKDSYINALKLENTLFWKDFIKRKTKIDIRKQLQKLQDDNDIDNKINIIKSIFKKIFPDSKVYLFISPYAPISGGTYPSYLGSSTRGLINILDSFSSIDNYNEQISEMVKKVFYGAFDSSNDSEEIIQLKKADKKYIGKSISDTWSNDYDDTYCAVRLTTINEAIINDYDNNIIDNDPIWFKPIGCIVVEDSQMDYMYHMEISRTVLSIKNYISYYLEQEFNYGVIQEAIMKLQFSEKHNNLQKETNKLIKEKEALEKENEKLMKNIRVQEKSLKKREKDFEIRLEKLSHSLTRYINLETPIDVFIDDMKEKYQISKCKDHDDFIEIMRTYSYGMMLHTGLQETKTYADKNGKEEYDIYEVVHEENFQKWLLEFISTASTMHNTLCPKCNTKTLDFSGLRQGSFILKFKSSSERANKKVSQDFMEYIIFELVFNTMKAQEGIDNPYIKLYSLSSDKDNYRRGICIENAVSKNFDFDEFKEKLENNELGMGIKSLTKIVEAQNYKLEHVCKDNIFKVYITHEEGK